MQVADVKPNADTAEPMSIDQSPSEFSSYEAEFANGRVRCSKGCRLACVCSFGAVDSEGDRVAIGSWTQVFSDPLNLALVSKLRGLRKQEKYFQACELANQLSSRGLRLQCTWQLISTRFEPIFAESVDTGKGVPTAAE